MSGLSNKTVVLLLVLAMVLSIGGTLISLSKVSKITGMATGVGNVSLTISSQSSVNMTVKTVNFGSGYVTSGCNNCTMDTLGTINSVCCSGFSVSGQVGLVVENTGNTNLSIDAQFDNAASAFLGGTTPAPKFMMLAVNNESSSCVNSTDTDAANGGAGVNVTYRNFFDVVTTQTQICAKLTPDLAKDSLRMHFNVTVPGNAPAKAGNSTVTITATDV